MFLFDWTGERGKLFIDKLTHKANDFMEVESSEEDRNENDF
jgi:hypothetical protein